MANKLELTWVGKEERIEVEPRILIEVPDKSFSESADDLLTAATFDNMLIHGDNLLALKALEAKFAGQVKCIYIDPPYNTGSAFEHYDDALEHSIWLNLMYKRLIILKNLLSDEGMLFVQIDDNEQAYLTIMLDEIFGRTQRINTICVKMSEASGVKMSHVDKKLPKLKEYILMYCKKNVSKLTEELVKIDKWNEEYKHIIVGIPEEEINELHSLINKENADKNAINRCNEILSKGMVESLTTYFKKNNILENEQEEWKFKNSKYIIQAVGSTSVFNIAKNTKMLPQDIMAVSSATGLIYLIKTDVNLSAKQPRIQVIFADENLMRSQGDLWLDIKLR